MKPSYRFIIILLCLVFSSCARIVTPKGGEKDTVAPKYVSSYPKENAVNFSGNKIEIVFDEFIVLDNATGKLIVSPPLKQKPTVGSKLNKLYVKGLDSLAENTTYIFDFGDAVTDFTEGNRLSHFAFAFSTGGDIDTLSFSGRILNAYTRKPEPAKYVSLYRNDDRQYMRENLPDYITRADSAGRFYFRNIKEGDYAVLAFEDLNQNMIYDLVTEGYGYALAQVKPETVSETAEDTVEKPAKQRLSNVVLFNSAEDTVQKILSSKAVNERELQIITSMPADESLAIHFMQPPIGEDDFTVLYNQKRDTITVINKTDKIFDTIKAEIADKNGFSDKLDLTYNVRKKRNKDERKTFALSLQERVVPYFEKLTLISPNHINTSLNPDLNALIADGTDTISVRFRADTLNFKRFYCMDSLKHGHTYTLYIDSMQIYDYDGKYNDTLTAEFRIDTEDDYGSFVISVTDTADSVYNSEDSARSIILTLFDGQDNRVGDDKFTVINSEAECFGNLKEGKYRLRMILDANNNRKWDKGEFDTNKEPEKVMFFDKIISVRKGWQTIEQWNIPSNR